ncbi:hypothetical protein F8S13_01720 [Chloroflexia bacterium SDU3-3]|nr:hypothetical protein F8S13_01720 [Chloroflexia bacterium SDU3-3]
MSVYTEEELRPLASLISKSEKAQQKVAEGTWQHRMLHQNLRALRLASALLQAHPGVASSCGPEELQEAARTLAAMIAKVAQTQEQFAPGTAQHTLQRNRLRALRIAEERVRAAL